MKYELTPGIAALVNIKAAEEINSDGIPHTLITHYTAIYMNEREDIRVYQGSDMSRTVSFPKPIMYFLEDHFSKVFSRPVEERQALLDAIKPQIIECN